MSSGLTPIPKPRSAERFDKKYALIFQMGRSVVRLRPCPSESRFSTPMWLEAHSSTLMIFPQRDATAGSAVSARPAGPVQARAFQPTARRQPDVVGRQENKLPPGPNLVDPAVSPLVVGFSMMPAINEGWFDRVYAPTAFGPYGVGP